MIQLVIMMQVQSMRIKPLTVSAGSGVLSNDTDADASSSLSVSAISGGTVGQALNGTYGVLTLSSDGSYTYVANGRSGGCTSC